MTAIALGVLPMAQDLDDVSIAFDPRFTLAIKVMVAVFLFGIALDTKVSDFRTVLERPRAIAIGILAQYAVLPALTFLLTLALHVRGSVALGMILVACCPPGNLSNILTHRARGDVALSVSMSAISNLLAIVLTPLLLAFWAGLQPEAEPLLTSVDLDPLELLAEILLVLGVPFVLGVALGTVRPAWAARIRKVVDPVIVVALLLIVIAGLAGNFSYFIGFVGVVVVAVALQDAMALLLGYGIGRATRLPAASTKAVTFETGVRNTALGLVLVLAYFDGLGGMALVVAFWGLWDVATGLALATWWRRRTAVPATPAAPVG